MPETTPEKPEDLAALRSKLDASDRKAALQVLELAILQLGDGATLVWKRPERGLIGVIKPISAFRDDQGRLCRSLSYSITLGDYSRTVEGKACRNADGNWQLSG